ncbi:hypothetical protein CLV28_2745 [Sediminihabitans luteus]|uniref:Uncharacterized protein n=1 Tax=Sediminihabitans luteus TaxID=1138585 RepID=A0A2M9CD54_9CELL|nr:hypothetical protein [Sediminihabitans luteus]PJJ69280.1 hypothetical protein CLV28_2745 [Sediminihabitans luteus]GII98962.1 hypothetical protein Slu03_13400 [Sediminihabitans luteus]
MTSTSTSRSAAHLAAPASARPGTTNPAARFAAAGILALATMLPFVGAPTAAASSVQQVIAAARTHTDAITLSLAQVDDDVRRLLGTLQAEVGDAVASARAATEQAVSALAAADDAARSPESGTTSITDPELRASVELADAQVALDAASAQLRYVTSALDESGVGVPSSLVALGERIDTLRGRTAGS